MFLESERLFFRQLTQEDYADLCSILQDEQVMYAYEHAFSDEEVQQWLERQRMRYEKDGFGLWAVCLKENGQMIGQAGLTMQDWDGRQVVEVGYLFKKAFWRQGYGTEAAICCRDYAFHTLSVPAVYSIIRDTNTASKKVAQRNQMRKVGELVKYYYGCVMPHDVFCVTAEELQPKNKRR